MNMIKSNLMAVDYMIDIHISVEIGIQTEICHGDESSFKFHFARNMVFKGNKM